MVQCGDTPLQRVDQQVEEVLRVVRTARNQITAVLRFRRHFQHVTGDVEAHRIAALANAGEKIALLLQYVQLPCY